MTFPYRTTLAGALALTAAFLLPPPNARSQPDEEQISIEELLKSGWQVAGFTSGYDNRAALLLFRHPTETSLVQCLSGYDVTRTPRTYSNCYRLR